ncbi:hypothetical protein PACTADRAFT_24362, partial [Pachysolen tannophilus NRRL Y-2460]
WVPTSSITYGRAISSFLPLDQPNLRKLENVYKNIYPGDQVYIFETNGIQWARGYIVSQPTPSDFSSSVINLNKLPDRKVQIGIFPMSIITVIEQLAITKYDDSESLDAIGKPSEFDVVPRILDTELFNEVAINGEGTLDFATSKHPKPQLPLSNKREDLIDEIKSATLFLVSHIYALYSLGEFQLFNKLVELYSELDDIRLTLGNDLCTKNERIYLKKEASALLTKISKYLASRGKLNKFEEKEKDRLAAGDVSGYEAILARSPETGELLASSDIRTVATTASDLSKNASPYALVMNQLLYALSSGYPNTNLAADLSPQTRNRLERIPLSNILVDFKSVISSSVHIPKGFMSMTAYLFLRNKKRALTEAFAIKIDASQELLLENVSAALFKNIPSTEVDNNGKVYLVALLTEEIDLSGYQKHLDLNTIKKGIAAGVTDISRIFSRHKGALASGQSHQFTVKLYGSYIGPDDNVNATPVTKNNGWGEVVERIIHGSNVGIAINPRAERIIVSIKEIQDEALLNEKFEHLDETTNVSSSALIPIRTLLFDPLSDSYERVHIRLLRINLIQKVSDSLKDSFLSIHFTSDNENFKFKRATNEAPTSTWACVSVVEDEVIGEIISLVGLSTLQTNHLGDSFIIKLFSNGVLRCEGKILFRKNGQIYDSDGKSKTIKLFSVISPGPEIGTIELATEYIGTHYNMDPVILNVFNWKLIFNSTENLEQCEQDVIVLLNELHKKPLDAYIKFFPKLLLSLFNLFNFSYSTKLSNILTKKIFESVVHLLDFVILKQDQYIYLFDDFCEKYAKNTSVTLGFFQLGAEIYNNANKVWSHISRQYARVAPLLFKMSVICNKDENEALKQGFYSLHIAMLNFLKFVDEKLLSEQVLILDNFFYYLEAIKPLYSKGEIWNLCVKVIESLGLRGLGAKDEADAILSKARKKDENEHKLIIAKMLLIGQCIQSKWLIKDSDQDSMIYHSIHWSLEVFSSAYDLDSARLAIGNLVRCFQFIWNDVYSNDNNAKEERTYLLRCCVRLLPIISKAFNKYNKYCKIQKLFKTKRTFTHLFQLEYPFVEHTMDSIVTKEFFVELLIEFSTLFIYISKFLKKVVDIEKGFDFIKFDEKDAHFIANDQNNYFTMALSETDVLSIVQASKIISRGSFYPSNKWLSLNAVLTESSYTILEMLKYNMINQYIPPQDDAKIFDKALWGTYLKTIYKISTLKTVAYEQLSDIPRKACHQLLGDLRTRSATLIAEVWDSLATETSKENYMRFKLKRFGGYQMEFISNNNGILNDNLLLGFQKHEKCQVLGAKICWDIIVAEWLLKESLDDLGKETLIGLYDLFHSESYKPAVTELKLFIDLLKKTVMVDPEDEAFKAIFNYAGKCAEFLFVLDDLRNVPLSDEFDDDRTFHKLNILGFLLQINSPELLYGFIDEMYQTNISKGNYVQAALSLELLADTYDWSLHTLLAPISKPSFPQQTPFERKESLYRLIGHNYAKGNSLEQAVEVYKELRDSYENITLDLRGLAYVNGKLSKIYENLENIDRIMPAYFKVSFIGRGFPKTVRGKHFIYQGLPFEQLSSIQDRLSRVYPGSRTVTKDSEIAKLVSESPLGKYLHITSVDPGKGFQTETAHASYSARRYLQNKNLIHFTTVKRLPGASGITDLWSEEITYETYLTFPALMNRSEIKDTKTTKLSPLENGYRMIVTKNQDLANIELIICNAFREKLDVQSFFNDLSRQVSGTVDSPVNGGVGQYRVFFDDPTYKSEVYAEKVQSLKNAFNDLAIILNRCLDLHGKLVPAQLRASHDSLVELYKKNFKEEIENLNI